MNQPLKTILIDDEKSALNSLKIIIEEFAPSLRVHGTAQSAREGIQLIRELSPDLVFLDIQMPHMTGIELVETFGPQRTFEVVFLTAHNNFATEAFKLNAFHYLLKPVNVSDFLAVVTKLSGTRQQAAEEERQQSLKRSMANRITVANSGGVEFINIPDVIRIEGSGSYVTVHFVNKKPLLFSKNLKMMEDLLHNQPFFRAHKSHLININYIQKFQSLKDGGTITMTDGSQIELSRHHKDDFISLYKV